MASRTVLIVDDHPGFRAVARMLLESGGWEVVGEEGSVDAGVESARRLAPALVVVDVNLPDGDGFDASRRLTAGPGGPAVILVSSRDGEDYAGRATECGARAFIPKAELTCAGIAAIVP